MSINNYRDITGAEADIRHTLSRNLRLFRRLNGFSQEQLAEHSGLHRTYVGAVERREIGIGVDNLQRLAEALGTSPAALLDTQCFKLPANVRETVPAYARHRYQSQNVVDMRQFAMFRLWTILRHSPVMTSHESHCKEAIGPAGANDAYPEWLVTGSARRAERTQPQLHRGGRTRRA